MNVCRRFIEGLKDHNLTHEDIQSWKYIGGSGRHDSYFHLKFQDEEDRFTPPDKQSQCICKTAISEQCWIVDEKCLISKKNDKVLVIGNCCNRHVLPDCGRNCGKYGAPHKNRVIDRCNDCKYTCEKCSRKKECLASLFCNDCRTKQCESCDRTIKFKFRLCYKCHRELQKKKDT